ncbi:hypothetical protein J7W19_29170 [Streptomyces mobaraensis NBRC 13819 = DSM 40847]|uniref:Uncharacterized protein n=1 Tax=Streptomyces mobaraensis (strain ATCC 29032 / DSM 40847 / JCM 4168 / NBRC 13819 / NCIMB 11159 / IPCR 16-22) TaxID=1223523 RepID=M3BRY3_STRM1|nr:hypothetical protein [Streptomyces mobaraensis]EMF02440.1 hypothetical protein H340_01299 [Streptomyces mobaraensis NBRC 13819 = DSM 40847]QTT76910.1 hypothetical protein J7W19_29170 [Streptomyces mobaraensis NBRC 13819 = DSM 40847]
MGNELSTVAGMYKGLLHGVDRHGYADVEFPNAHKATAFAAGFIKGQSMMRQEWAPGVDGYSVNLDHPVVLTFNLSSFTKSLTS